MATATPGSVCVRRAGSTYTPGGMTLRAMRMAASLLRSVGHPDVTDLVGGYAAWEQQTVDA